jgi:hypothetical protein
VRLTLRTLLAYLDDTLEPAEIKRIGQKVAESETARELIARIKSVTRRRRLTTPPLTGSADKFDPNTVAEYLDNTLSPEQVEEIERICLESDVHLAEIAACHQILTLVLGEPALVPPSAKRRMVALAGEGRPSGIRKKLPAAAAARDLEDRGEDDALLLGLPALRRGGSGLRWLIPIAGCILLAMLAFTVYKIYTTLPGDDYAQRRRERPGGGAPVAANTDKTSPPKQNGQVEQPEPKDGKTNGGKNGKANGEPNKDGKPLEKPGDVPAKVEPVKPGAGSTKAPLWSAAPPSDKRQALGKLVRNDAWQDLVMQSAGTDGRWRRLAAAPPNDRFNTGDTLVSLPGFRSELALDSGVHLILWGNVEEQLKGPILESAITPYATEPDKDGGRSDLDFTLDRGRVWIVNKKKDDQPAYVRLRFHKEIWDLTLQPGTEVGMELVGREIGLKPTQAEEEPGAVLWLVVKKGNLSVRDDLREFPPMTAPAQFTWTNTRGPAPGPEALPQQQWPPYWEQPVQISRGVASGPEMDRALTALRNRLTDNRPTGAMLTETIDLAEGPAGRILTVLCFGAIDEIEYLADFLGNERYPEVRDGAVEALRQWLGRGVGQRERFRKVLDGKYTKSEADTILYFLRMPGAEDQRERDTYAIPIDQLNNDKLAIRHLAWWHLLRMANREMRENKLAFDPAGPPELRELVQKKWRRLYDDGKLPPDPARGQPAGAGKQ